MKRDNESLMICHWHKKLGIFISFFNITFEIKTAELNFLVLSAVS